MLNCFSHVQLFATLCHGLLQTRILWWVAMPSSRGSSQLRDWTHMSPALAGRFFTTSVTCKSCTSLVPYPYLAPPPFHHLAGDHYFVLCICESGLLYTFICFIFQIPHINNILQYLSFSDITLSIIFSSFIHITANVAEFPSF